MRARHDDWRQVGDVRHIAERERISRLTVVDELACSGDTINQSRGVAPECDRRALEWDVDRCKLFCVAATGRWIHMRRRADAASFENPDLVADANALDELQVARVRQINSGEAVERASLPSNARAVLRTDGPRADQNKLTDIDAVVVAERTREVSASAPTESVLPSLRSYFC
jgi:hypothetical protein